MKSIFVTGANGFIGQYLVVALLRKGYFVIGSGRGDSRFPHHENFLYCQLDLADDAAVITALEKHRPHAIIHCAAISRPDECEMNQDGAMRINFQVTAQLLKQAAKIRSFFIFLSTDFVFSGDHEIYKEEDATAPVNYYGYTKQLAEKEVMKYPGCWSIVRTVLVYGKPVGARNNLLTLVADRITKRQQIKIFDDQVRTPTYVGDLVNGICAIAEKEVAGIFHLSGEDVRTPYEMAVEVAKHMGVDPGLVIKITAEDLPEPARRPRRTVFDLSKAKKQLGYHPISFSEGVKRTFE
jgi:dTDP-4-dehydrorhamnose reductase